MNTQEFLSYVTAFGAVATPVLVATLGIVGWRLRVQTERRLELEKQLRDDRIEIYNGILAPFIMFFMTEEAWNMDPKNKHRNKNEIATREALSLEYRKHAFRLALVGSDGVVKAYNDLMQHFFEAEKHGDAPIEERTKMMMGAIGKLLLEIRRSMGNESTKLDKWSMLEWFITDARTYRE